MIYARVSTERQSEASIEDQLRVCRDYAVAQGWDIAATYSDEGISGAAFENRPGVQAALASLFARDVLIVTDLSRLSRSQDLAPLLARLRHRGVRVIGVQDGFDSDSRTARLQAGLSGIMSEEFRSMVADRTHSALEMRARNGEATGGKAYENAEIVLEIFTRFAAGEAMKSIASDLNRRNIPSPGATWKPRARPRGRWLISTLHALLRNERYAGRVVWNRSQWVKDPDTGRRLRRERPESEWIVTTCEPIISAELWRRTQGRFRVRTGRGGRPRWLLSGILECAVCGGKMIVTGGAQHRYLCGMNHHGGPHACPNNSTFPRELAERLILEPVINDLLSPEAVTEGIRLMRRERAVPFTPEPPDRELVELERLVRDGVLSSEVAAPAIAEARRKTQQQRAEALQFSQPWPTEKAWIEAVAGMRQLLSSGADVGAAREILRDLIGPALCHMAQNGHVSVQLTTRRVMLATGTSGPGGRLGGRGGGRSMQSGPPLPTDLLDIVVRIPTSTRRRS